VGCGGVWWGPVLDPALDPDPDLDPKGLQQEILAPKALQKIMEQHD